MPISPEQVSPILRRANPARQKFGRRVVLAVVGVFVAAQLLSGYLLDHYGTRIRFPSACHIWSEAENGPRPNLIWLGSSRTGFSIRHDVINRGLWKQYGHHQVSLFNAGVPLGDPVAMEFVFDGLLKRGQRPQVLILETSPEFLARNCLWLGAHAHRQLGWADAPEVAGEACHSGNLGRLLLARLLPLYVHRQQLRARLIAQWYSTPVEEQRESQQGGAYGPVYDDSPALPSDLTRAGGRLPCDPGMFRRLFQNYQPDGIAAAAFERILERCDQEGIAVILVAPPVVEELRALYTPEFESRFQAHLASLRQRHSFEFHDLRASIPDPGFSDMHHLNPRGAILYSHLALQRVVLPGAEAAVQRGRANRSLSQRR